MGPERSLDQSDAEIVASLYGDLVRFAAAVAPLGDEPDDLAQEAIARVLVRRSLRTLDEPATYLRRVVVNLTKNRHRSMQRRLRAWSRLGPREPASDVYPSDVAALLALNPETRAVLWMADVEGYGFDEIARVLSLTPSAARQRASRGRADLRRRLADGEFDAPPDPLPGKAIP